MKAACFCLVEVKKGSDRMYPYDKYNKNKQKLYRVIRVDPATHEWLHKNPDASADIRMCRTCGSYYMPSLGHTCKGV